ncbi:uncharacterized protein LOC112572043 isoform X2 [Pomacea canaliculata]|uniref:uncharacterized protein LOC112572043 isoform X2 n=1 Tax=Pomacea canaliculata TaxID=400727 RepID=UPI000D734745|nr:uncharacterized protein LOC112572043 isoform X2 [Pomacea canaliculata]
MQISVPVHARCLAPVSSETFHGPVSLINVSGPACLAVNGNTNTNFRTLNKFPDSPNCIHTGNNDRNPNWEVNLGQRYAIVSITIYWNNAYLERSKGVKVTVDGQLCHVFQNTASNPSSFSCRTPLTGQTVRLSKTDYTSDYYLTVCEVEVWGLSCACSAYGVCDFSNQDLKSISPRKVNVALGKPAKMSSMYTDEPHNEVSGPACLAVNGNRNTAFRPINQFPDSPNCIHTEAVDREPYWEVDLGQPYTIASIAIYWRDSQPQRSDGVKVSVDGQFCHRFQRPVANPSRITCGTPLTGQTFRLSKADHVTTGDYFLTVCEVEVIVCGPGYFGTDCERVCPQVCEKNQTCSPVDGTCPQARKSLPSTVDITSLAPLTPDIPSSAPLTHDVTSSAPLTRDVTSSAPLTHDVTSSAPLTHDVTSSAPLTHDVTSSAPLTHDVTSSAPLTQDVTSSAPLTHDVTRMALIIAGSFLCGCVVTVICAALVLWLRRVKGRQRGCDSRSQGGDVIMTKIRENTRVSPPDAAECSGFAQSAAGTGQGPDDDKSADYINVSMSQSLEDVLPKKKANAYKPFPTRRHVATIPDSSSSDNEEYEEMM